MKPERQLWVRELQPALKAIAGLVYNRIELKTGDPGIPDVMYSLNGTGWIELKDTRSKTPWPPSIDLSGWEPEQRAWAKRHRRSGAKVWLMVRAGAIVALIDPITCYDLDQVDWSDHLAVRWTTDSMARPVDRIRLAELLKVGP